MRLTTAARLFRPWLRALRQVPWLVLPMLLLLQACAGAPSASTAGNLPGPAQAAQDTAPPPRPDRPATASPAPDDARPRATELRDQREEVPAQAPPARRAGARPAAVEVDRSCRSDRDCVVKNVGNCCGEYPACVNVDSPTDPEGVQARCAASGMASVCGFPVITGCQCRAGQCESADDGRLP